MTDDDEPAKPAPRTSRSRVLAAIGVVVVALVCLCGGGIMFARRAFVGYAARSALAAHGITCDDDFSVSVDGAMAHATVTPCTCTAEEGAIATITLVDPVTADLEGETVTHVHAGHVRVSMRGEGPAVEAGSLGPLASTLGVPARIGALVSAASQLAAMHAPALDVATLEVEQSERTTVSARALTLDGRTPLALGADQVELPALTGPLGARASVTITTLTGTATASDVHLGGDLALTGTAPILGSVTRSGHVTVTGIALGSDAPSYRIDLE